VTVGRLGGLVSIVLALAVAASAAAQQHEHPATAGEKLGTVHFATSCSAAAQPQFDRAVALLHSFEFGGAIDGFGAAAATDSGCAIAFWGVALSRWGNPFAAGERPVPQLQQGLVAIGRAKQTGAKTERERRYIAAAELLYANYELLQMQEPTLALKEFQATLTKEPNRFRAVYGAAHAAALAGDGTTARTYYDQLLKICARADLPGRPELSEARNKR
jgi:tetratricopeptide (TPR) repeat protein